MKSGSHRVAGVKGEIRGTGLTRQAALKDTGIHSMQIDVGLQTLTCHRTWFECKDADALAFPMKKDCRQPDIGSNVEDTISVVQRNAVLQVAPRSKDFPVNEARFIRIQRKHR